MQHPDHLHLQAYFDGEMDSLAAAGIEQHAEQCRQCRSVLNDFEGARAALREDLPDYRAPDGLRARLKQALDEESRVTSPARSFVAPQPRGRTRWSWPSWQFWLGSLSGGGVAAAALLASMVWIPRSDSITSDLVSAHVRALTSSHPVDVISTDRHTVKPWFSGHADVSPVVADFEAQGYKLVGGRADYMEHQRAAVLVYQHGAHSIDVFSWAAGSHSLPRNVSRYGFHVVCWRTQDLDYCAVSDAGWDELHELQRLLQDLSAQDAP
jgi:anti-sigma factor RsiW